MFERAFLRVDVSEGNMSFGFLRRDHFPLSAWLFTKAKGLVWRTVDFVSSTLLAAPSGLGGHPRDSVLKVLVLWGEGWKRYGCAGEGHYRRPTVGECMWGWLPHFSYKVAFIVKGQAELGEGS